MIFDDDSEGDGFLKRNGSMRVHSIYCYVNNIVIIACFGKTLLGYPTIPAWVFKSLS